MNEEIQALEALRREFERVVAVPQSRRQWLAWRWRPLAAIAAVTLVGATGALAAAGVIPLGKPVGGANGPRSPLVGSGEVKATSVRLLTVRAADPAGGLPWGMLLETTTRGLGCLTVGREQDGRLGVLGQDNVFGDDGEFHPLPAGSNATPRVCAPLDAQGRLFLNAYAGEVPASGLNANGLKAGGCLSPDVHEPGGTFCPVRDERSVYFGQLGPQATSLTYTAPNGIPHTLVPRGPDGAYLIVQRATQSPGSINNGLTLGLQPYPPITAVTYRNGLRCNFSNETPLPQACRVPPGYTPAHTPHYSAAALASPVHATIRPAGSGHWSLTVSFTAREPVTNALASYNATLQAPPDAYGISRSTDVRRGARVTYRWQALPLPRGTYHGTIEFTTGTHLGPLFALHPRSGNNVLVGRFTIRIP